MPAETIKCKDCGKEFEFSESEQQFYIAKGFDNRPKRCKPCRDKRRNDRDQSTAGHGRV
jgi:hypothetical protein